MQEVGNDGLGLAPHHVTGKGLVNLACRSARCIRCAAGKNAAPKPVLPASTPEPEPVAPPAPLPRVARRGSPDGLRERLALR